MYLTKKIVIVSVFLFIFITFSTCANKENLYSNKSEVSFDVQYLRIGYGPKQPIYTVISSVNELNQYINNNGNGSYLTDEYSNATKKYTNQFFNDNFLIIVFLEEPSGSNRHKVEKIETNGDIVITQIIPEIGTADMATWIIFIELKNSSKLEQYKVVLK